MIWFLATVCSQSNIAQSSDVDEFPILAVCGSEVPAISFADLLAHLVLPQYPAYTSAVMLVLQPYQHSLINPKVQIVSIVFETDMAIVISPSTYKPVKRLETHLRGRIRHSTLGHFVDLCLESAYVLSARRYSQPGCVGVQPPLDVKTEEIQTLCQVSDVGLFGNRLRADSPETRRRTRRP